jgi:hypothetical protein
MLCLLVLVALAACGPVTAPNQDTKVLFVGNSLTYVGNVPALYTALAEQNGIASPSDMIVRGGATLTQRLADGSVSRALASGTYSHLVIQERGGDLMCAFGADACAEARDAVVALAALGKRHDASVILLGTYQLDPASSRRLVEEEAAAAARAGIPYIEVSETLRTLREGNLQLAWFADDGFHPGKDLALLNAILVYRSVHDALPGTGPLTVEAPIYGSTSGLDETLRSSGSPPPLAATPMRIQYTSRQMGTLVESVR